MLAATITFNDDNYFWYLQSIFLDSTFHAKASPKIVTTFIIIK